MRKGSVVSPDATGDSSRTANRSRFNRVSHQIRDGFTKHKAIHGCHHPIGVVDGDPLIALFGQNPE